MTESSHHCEKKALPIYLEEHIPEMMDKISLLQSDQTINFIFMTDPHHVLSGNQLQTAQVIKRLSEEAELDFILIGGDLSANNPKDTFLETQKEITDELKKNSLPVLMVKGNHDDNSIYDFHHKTGSLDNLVYLQETYDLMCEHLEGKVEFDQTNPLGLYSYFDISDKQTRVISLNSIDIPYVKTEEDALKYNGQWKYAFSNEQLNWMAHEALNFKEKSDSDKWNVIILSHIAILQEDVYGADHDVENGEVMWELLKAFQTGSAYKSITTTGDFKQSVEVDFKDQGSHQIYSTFFGHVHYDQEVTKDNILTISSLNAVTGMDFEDSPQRTTGTITETAFDIVTVDPAQDKVFMTRFGAGEDRVYDIPNPAKVR